MLSFKQFLNENDFGDGWAHPDGAVKFTKLTAPHETIAQQAGKTPKELFDRGSVRFLHKNNQSHFEYNDNLHGHRTAKSEIGKLPYGHNIHIDLHRKDGKRTYHFFETSGDAARFVQNRINAHEKI